jgi:hypothetical protein
VVIKKRSSLLVTCHDQWLWFVVFVVTFLSGCRSGGDKRYDLLEAELRARERELAEAQAELNGVRALTHMAPAARADCDVLPAGSVAGRGPGCRDISLGAGTGGYDADGRPGDEGLQIVLVPKDDDGSAIKVPGRLVVTAYDLARDGTKTPVGLWEIPAEKLRLYWQSGLFGSGYKLSLQWHRAPVSDKVRVVARLTTLEGKPFETDKDVTVKPLGPLGPLDPASCPPELPPPGGLPSPPGDPFHSGVRLKPARAG